MSSLSIRPVSPKDGEGILSIYAPHIEKTAVTFEYEVPALSDFQNRIEKIAAKYPYLVLEKDGRAAGYCYASEHMARAAYQWNASVSIYLSDPMQRQKAGTALYFALLSLLKLQGFYSACAIVTLPNDKSLGFHKAQGFEPFGVYPRAGFKFGAWHDVAFLTKPLANYQTPPAPTIPLLSLGEEKIARVLRMAQDMLSPKNND